MTTEYLIPEKLDLNLFIGNDFKTRCLRIINHIALNCARGEKRYGFVNIHSSDLRHLSGDNARIYVTFLIKKRIVEKNDRYSNNEMAKSGRFTKSYRFTEHMGNSFKTVRTEGTPLKPVLSDKSDKNDAVCKAIAVNVCQLGLNHARMASERFEVNSEALSLIANLNAGYANCKRGKKVKRIYHRINTASKEVRSLLTFNGNPLVEYDMKSAHPVLALSLYPDPNCEEALAYKELLKKDVYSIYGISRDEAKKLLRKFFYSKKHMIRKDGSSINPIANYFKYHFPLLFSAIVSSSDLTVRMQNLESFLFNDFIVPKTTEWDLFYISIHDGFLCASKEAAKTIIYSIQQEFNQYYGYIPVIEEKKPAKALPFYDSVCVEGKQELQRLLNEIRQDDAEWFKPLETKGQPR